LLMRASQGHAAMQGNEFVRPDDVKAVASAVLAHRVLTRAETRARGQTAEQAIATIVDGVPAPVPVA
jgi:MoxR-like ATPase